MMINSIGIALSEFALVRLLCSNDSLKGLGFLARWILQNSDHLCVLVLPYLEKLEKKM